MEDISKKTLVIIDAQNDLIDNNTESKKIIPNLVKLINNWDKNGRIFVTLDTHENDYWNTLEGKYNQNEHCIYNTSGWYINEYIKDALDSHPSYLVNFINKSTFGSLKLIHDMSLVTWNNIISTEEIYIAGFYTDTNVIANALLIRAQFPQLKIYCYKNCCVGTNKETHDAALRIMKQNNIEII